VWRPQGRTSYPVAIVQGIRSLSARVLAEVFPRFVSKLDLTPRGRDAAPAAKLRWLGTASHHIELGGKSILVDPFVSRPSLSAVALRPLLPNAKEIASYTDFPVDAIVCGHSHYDHIMDAPEIAAKTGALLVGSASTCQWGHARGLPESQLRVVPERGTTLQLGDVTIEFIPSRHGKITFGRVPFPGKVSRVPSGPGRLWDYKMGGAFGILIRDEHVSIYHNGSADLVDAELEGKRADVLLACLAGRKGTERYLMRLVDALQPSLIVPSHHDAFFAPLAEGVRLLPRIDLEGFLAEAKSVAPNATRITPVYQETLLVSHDVRGSVLEER
jgi:L-ascorbate metabolism protein UlaG (beta-lactamase superfamily)